jgi:hypothetical protein
MRGRVTIGKRRRGKRKEREEQGKGTTKDRKE